MRTRSVKRTRSLVELGDGMGVRLGTRLKVSASFHISGAVPNAITPVKPRKCWGQPVWLLRKVS
jgi:hypothetical protein